MPAQFVLDDVLGSYLEKCGMFERFAKLSRRNAPWADDEREVAEVEHEHDLRVSAFWDEFLAKLVVNGLLHEFIKEVAWCDGGIDELRIMILGDYATCVEISDDTAKELVRDRPIVAELSKVERRVLGLWKIVI